MNRFGYIDALRGLAIFGVIFTHAGSASGLDGVYRGLFGYGGYGVQLFFVISAFTVFLSYRRGLQTESAPLANFFTPRLLRIAPVYFAGIVVYTLVFGLESRGWRPGPELWHYPLHMTFTNVLWPTTTSSVVPGGWSISVEVLFYLTCPLWFGIVTSLRRAAVFTAVWLVLGTLCLRYAPYYVQIPDVPMGEMRTWGYRLPFAQAACFGLGMILYFLHDDPRFAGFARRRGAAAGLVFVAAGLLALSWGAGPGPGPRHFLVAGGCLALALALAIRPYRLLVNPALRHLGKVSFSAYILHFLVIQGLLRLLPASDGGIADALLLATAALAISWALAALSWRWYERFWTGTATRIIAQREAGLRGPKQAEPAAAGVPVI